MDHGHLQPHIRLHQNYSLLYLAIGLFVLISGCGGGSSNGTPPVLVSEASDTDADVDGSSFYITGNNSAVLMGPVVGSGTSTNASLRKELSVSGPANSLIEIRRAYVTDSLIDQLIVVLENISTQNLCFIDLEGVLVTDATGVADVGTIVTEPFASASLGLFDSSAIYTDTCLAPGEKGYAHTIVEESDFNRISEISVATIRVTNIDTLASERIIPVQYTLNDGSVTLTIQNQSASSVTLSPFYSYVYLDELGFPLNAGTGRIPEPFVLAPGAEITVSDPLSDAIAGFFTGSTSSIRFIVGIN